MAEHELLDRAEHASKRHFAGHLDGFAQVEFMIFFGVLLAVVPHQPLTPGHRTGVPSIHGEPNQRRRPHAATSNHDVPIRHYITNTSYTRPAAGAVPTSPRSADGKASQRDERRLALPWCGSGAL